MKIKDHSITPKDVVDIVAAMIRSSPKDLVLDQEQFVGEMLSNESISPEDRVWLLVNGTNNFGEVFRLVAAKVVEVAAGSEASAMTKKVIATARCVADGSATKKSLLDADFPGANEASKSLAKVGGGTALESVAYVAGYELACDVAKTFMETKDGESLS